MGGRSCLRRHHDHRHRQRELEVPPLTLGLLCVTPRFQFRLLHFQLLPISRRIKIFTQSIPLRNFVACLSIYLSSICFSFHRATRDADWSGVEGRRLSRQRAPIGRPRPLKFSIRRRSIRSQLSKFAIALGELMCSTLIPYAILLC